MTVTLTGAGGLFTILKLAITASEVCNTHHGTTAPTDIEDVLTAMADLTDVDTVAFTSSLASAARGYRSVATIPTACKNFAQALVIDRVTADQPQVAASISACLDELERQMTTATVERNVPAASVSHPDADVPRLLVCLVDGEGLTVECAIDETIVGVYSTPTSLSVTSGPAQRNMLAPDWPLGSEVRTTLSVETDGVLLNQSFDDQDDWAGSPDDWIVVTGVRGTTVVLTVSEVQTIQISPTPGSGYWIITFTNADGDVQVTDPLTFDASAAEVQAALAALVGLEDVTVELDGDTYTVSFNAVAPPGDQALLSVSTYLGASSGSSGSSVSSPTATVTEVTAGEPSYEYICLGILGTAATETTTLRQRMHSLNLTPNSVLAVSVQAKKIAGTTGNLYVELVDGTGTVINNEAGTANRITIDMSTLSSAAFGPQSGFFQLPSDLPDVWYLQIRVDDIADTKGIYLDDLIVTPMRQLYSGGPFVALVANARDLEDGDRYTITVTNTWAGKIQTWWYRWFNRLLPSAASGAETISDP